MNRFDRLELLRLQDQVNDTWSCIQEMRETLEERLFAFPDSLVSSPACRDIAQSLHEVEFLDDSLYCSVDAFEEVLS